MYQKFIPKLQDHLFGRLVDRSFDGDAHDEFSDADRNSIRLIGNKIYTVKTCQLYYTTYDLQRKYDTVNPTSHPDVMVRSPETGPDASPYWYARVLGVYHANIWTTNPAVKDGSNIRRMDFLFVRWFGEEPDYRYGFRQARLPKIGFVLSSDDYAFGFLDPRHVVRGCHLVPAFHGGRTSELLPTEHSVARILEGAVVDDWANFYVNVYVSCECFKVECTYIVLITRFADRDLLMRHFGGGVGHINNTVVPSSMDSEAPSDRDVDSEEESVEGHGSANAQDSDLPQSENDDGVVQAESNIDEVDEEMAEVENDEDLEDDLNEDDDMLENNEDRNSDGDGYASL